MPKLVILVGPPGSGKSTLSEAFVSNGFNRVNQDDQGREGHAALFADLVFEGKDIVLDRMNFDKAQRARYLKVAKSAGYHTEIIVLHEPRKVCFQRMLKRENHPTIKDASSANSALNTFFSKYERPTQDEADGVEFVYPTGEKPKAIWSDLDGTLCNVEHRRHFVRPNKSLENTESSRPVFKKNWSRFFKEMVNDTVNQPVMDTLNKFSDTHHVVYCSGRPDNYIEGTGQWLVDKNAPNCFTLEERLFMRPRNDSRQDHIVKEIILDFEVLTRFSVDLCLDDRDQVVKMLRGRGLTVFQVAEGDF